MMTDHDSLTQRLATAQAAATNAVSQAEAATDPVDLRAAAQDIEAIAVDIMSVFEARMQHHFKRGPFYKEVQKRLIADGQTDLASRVIQYYHGVNVLKHGHGKSHRELLAMNNRAFRVRKHDRNDTDIGLVDVLSPGFSDGLIDVLTQAQAFLDTQS